MQIRVRTEWISIKSMDSLEKEIIAHNFFFLLFLIFFVHVRFWKSNQMLALHTLHSKCMCMHAYGVNWFHLFLVKAPIWMLKITHYFRLPTFTHVDQCMSIIQILFFLFCSILIHFRPNQTKKNKKKKKKKKQLNEYWIYDVNAVKY